jgi:hypothetical protein
LQLRDLNQQFQKESGMSEYLQKLEDFLCPPLKRPLPGYEREAAEIADFYLEKLGAFLRQEDKRIIKKIVKKTKDEGLAFNGERLYITDPRGRLLFVLDDAAAEGLPQDLFDLCKDSLDKADFRFGGERWQQKQEVVYAVATFGGPPLESWVQSRAFLFQPGGFDSCLVVSYHLALILTKYYSDNLVKLSAFPLALAVQTEIDER